MPELVAVFGGAFDPVHRGHVEPVRALLDQGVVDRVMVMPVFDPVHRGMPAVDAEHRLAMLHKAFADDDRIEVSTLEIDQARPSYSVWTMRALVTAHPDQIFCLLVGSDWSAGFGAWYRGWELPSLVHLIVMDRPGTDSKAETPDYFEPVDDAVALKNRRSGLRYAFDGPRYDISSTRIREACSGMNQESIKDMVPEKVYDYIQTHELCQ